MYEPETISELNENNDNKKYILAGYDKIPEERESENKYDNRDSEGKFSNERDMDNDNDIIEEASNPNNINTNSINKNIQNTKQINNKLISTKNKNTFFDNINITNTNSNSINNSNINNNYSNKNNKKLNISPKIKNKIKVNMPPYNKQLKNKKIDININYNNNKAQMKREQKSDKKDLNTLSENNNIEKEELINKKEENNINKDDNNIYTLSLNSFRDNNTTDRNEIEESSKIKKNSSRYKKSYRDSLAQNNLQLREINIRFILTKEEYAVLMKEKAKNQDVLID